MGRLWRAVRGPERFWLRHWATLLMGVVWTGGGLWMVLVNREIARLGYLLAGLGALLGLATELWPPARAGLVRALFAAATILIVVGTILIFRPLHG